jgi:hypothetical protein
MRFITVRLLCALMAVVLGLAGCATRYERRIPGLYAGYEDEQLGDRTYQVRVGKGWASDRPNLEKYALYRAAEITTEKGYHYFAIIGTNNFAINRALYAPSVSNTNVTGTMIGRTFTGTAVTTTTGGRAGVIEEHWAHLDFRLLDASEIRAHSDVIDAQKVISDLKFFIDRRRPLLIP